MMKFIALSLIHILSDAKAWLIKLQKVDGRGYSSIHSIRGVLRPAFQMAVDDDLIRKNPFGFELASVVVNDSVTREAISRKQERDLLKFIKEDKHFSRYYDGIYILFHTCLLYTSIPTWSEGKVPARQAGSISPPVCLSRRSISPNRQKPLKPRWAILPRSIPERRKRKPSPC